MTDTNISTSRNPLSQDNIDDSSNLKKKQTSSADPRPRQSSSSNKANSPISSTSNNHASYLRDAAIKDNGWDLAWGLLICQNEHSISFWKCLEESVVVEIKQAQLPLRLEKRCVNLRLLAKNYQEKALERVAMASKQRKTMLLERRHNLKLTRENSAKRVQLQKQKNRIDSLRLKARTDFALKAAGLKRELLLQRLIERCSSVVEKAQSLAIINRLKKCIELKKSYSSSFADVLGDMSLLEISSEPLFGGVPSEHGALIVSEFTHIPSPIASQDPPLDRIDTSPRSSPAVSTVTSPATISPTRQKLLLSPKSPKTPQSEFARSPTSPLKKSFSVTFPIGKHEFKDNLAHLTDLATVFGDHQPPITQASLMELNLDAISCNTQLRHDMLFDPNLEFRPNDDGERGLIKKAKSDVFWEDLAQDVNGKRYGKPRFHRIPALLNEIKIILTDLVATEDYRKSLESHMDIILIAQQLEHAVMNASDLMGFIAATMKAHCAPVRDASVDEMVKQCQEGNFIQSIRLCFEILEKMKLDVANDQLRRLRPYIVENAVEYEWEEFKRTLRDGSIALSATLLWLQPFIKSRAMIDPDKEASELFHEAYLSLIANFGLKQDHKIPETFKMDATRLTNFQSEWQDLTIMACILLIFKQVAGPRSHNLTLMKEMKKNIWVLLNDADTTMEHVTLYVSDHAGKTRGKALTPQENAALSTLIDKTLTPDNRIYEMMHKRIRTQLHACLRTKSIESPELLGKSGLLELADDLQDLAEKVRSLVEHNKAVYVKVYNQIIKTSQPE